MGVSTKRDIGAHVAAKTGTLPKNDDGSAAVTGTEIDLTTIGNPKSCVLNVQAGAATGSPTTQTLDAKIEHSPDNSTWADLSGAATTQIAADDTVEYLDVDLSGANRYVRVEHTVAFTGGSSPAWPVATQLIFGGADTLPLA
jgi:hypothetical protein